MTKKEKLRIYSRWFLFGVKERAIDLAFVTFPVFTMTGVITACVKFWTMVFGL